MDAFKPRIEDWESKDGLILLHAWARNGKNLQHIARKIGINEATLWKWRKQSPSINNALNDSREMADNMVEDALYKSALGYTDANGKEYPPNVNACIYWLKNRRSKEWRDKPVGEQDDEKSLQELSNALLTSAKQLLEGNSDNADEKASECDVADNEQSPVDTDRSG